FPRTEGQLPLIYNHKPTGRGDDYSDGSGQPLFPFGYGLSYTDFEYSNAVLSKKQISATESASISFKIKNTGKFDGSEIAQLYLYDELASVVRPVKELKAFQRVFLKAGEEKEISFSLTPEMFTLLDENLKIVTEPGFFRIMIGSSSKDIRLRERIEIK
ncbi:MAG: fibronectin type III-like domain-contianing protein, partial [Lentimicrobiaceae bacterium]|nr:fibronectin type III-like domain-contianing protein [Lentimicrobiaceae bacterium]